MITSVTVIAILGIVICVGMAFVIYVIVIHSKNKEKKYQQQGRNIFVRDGVDVKRQVLGLDKGAYFTSNLEENDTSLLNGVTRSAWQIIYRNIDNGEIFRYHFCGRMWIGRAEEHPGETSLLLKNDGMVSKTHCIVYEVEGRLCLKDQKSKNHTYMNGIRVDSPVYLENGCILRVGDTRFEVEYRR